MENQAPLLDQAKVASTSPGVYLMHDSGGQILYIGKAKNLRNRLVTYFQGQGTHPLPRTEMFVQRIARFDLILTETEAEALILESTLIKKHKPKFNVRLKDDKAYPYLKIQINDAYPRIEWTRRVLHDGARYFGPFPSAWAARQVMELLNETFQLRDCSDNTFRNRSRPCILYQIGKCSGPCAGQLTGGEYKERISQAIHVLEGDADRILKELKRGMEDAAEREEFEVAAEYRDRIQNLELVTSTQGVLEAGVERDRDVVGMARKEADAHGTLFQVRGGRLIAAKHFHLQNTDQSVPDSEVLMNFLAQYYSAQEQRGEGHRAKEVLLPTAPEDPDLLERAFGLKVRVAESEIDRRLLNVARTNAEYALEQNLRRGVGHGLASLEDVQEKLHLGKLPARIECYDISNIQGQDAVASRVVFMDGAPDKNLYRRYKIRTVEGANDFAMMKEVLGRRFLNSDEALPDLLVVDGGKGQLAQAVAILQALNIQGVDAVGLAKARTERDFKASEVKSTFERIFIPNRKNPVSLLPHTAAYKLLTHVRDEAHRFAISYHRLLRSKRSLKSEEV